LPLGGGGEEYATPWTGGKGRPLPGEGGGECSQPWSPSPPEGGGDQGPGGWDPGAIGVDGAPGVVGDPDEPGVPGVVGDPGDDGEPDGGVNGEPGVVGG
jgi:hypothetical protein